MSARSMPFLRIAPALLTLGPLIYPFGRMLVYPPDLNQWLLAIVMVLSFLATAMFARWGTSRLAGLSLASHALVVIVYFCGLGREIAAWGPGVSATVFGMVCGATTAAALLVAVWQIRRWCEEDRAGQSKLS